MSNARTIDSRGKPEIINVFRHFSDYNFCEKRFGGIPPLKRILSQARWHGIKTMIVEKIPLSEELERENHDLMIRTSGDFKEGQAFRISLFSKKIEVENLDNIKNLSDEDFIGYAIIRENIFNDANAPKYKNKKYILFESVTLPAISDNYFIIQNKFKVKIAGSLFNIIGAPFFQQNDLTHVCAHSSLRTLISLSKNDSILTPHEINHELKTNFSDCKFGEGKGLDDSQIIEIIKKNKLSFCNFVGSTSKKYVEKFSYQKCLYTTIESGFPGLLGFETTPLEGEKKKNHMVSVIGYTFNKHAWVPMAGLSYFKMGGKGYIPSESWINNFIIHDDNFGSYYFLPYDYLKLEDIRFCLGTLPDIIKSEPNEIEPIGLFFLDKILIRLNEDVDEGELSRKFPWLYRLLKYHSNERAILNTILIKKSSYLKHLSQMESWEGKKIDKKSINMYKKFLPNSFWMVEVSIPELFSANRRKLGEILIRSDVVIKPEILHDWSLFLFAHLPACLAVVNFSQNKFEFFPHSIKSHSAVYSQS